MLRTNYFLKPHGTEQSIRKIAIVFLEKQLEDEPKVTLELNEVTGLYSKHYDTLDVTTKSMASDMNEERGELCF